MNLSDDDRLELAEILYDLWHDGDNAPPPRLRSLPPAKQQNWFRLADRAQKIIDRAAATQHIASTLDVSQEHALMEAALSEARMYLKRPDHVTEGRLEFRLKELDKHRREA